MARSTDGEARRAEAKRLALARDLEQVARGDENAMARVYASTAPKLNALLVRMLRDPAEAEEALQDIYLKVWRRSASFDPTRASPITWLVAIARNRAIDRIRAKTAERRASAATAIDIVALSRSHEPDPKAIDEAEAGERLVRCIEALDARAQNAIRKAFYEDFTYEQLAAREGVPLGTMKSWIRRGLLSLRKCMSADADG